MTHVIEALLPLERSRSRVGGGARRGNPFLASGVEAGTVWAVARFAFRTFRKLRWWQQLAAVVCVPLAALNLSVAFFGHSAVFPLSPFHVREKGQALASYAKHRPLCLLKGHGDLTAIAAKAERRHGLPRGLMQAVVDVESGNQAHRISFAGAMGPAQLVPGTAAMLGVEDPFDPESSIDAGARYLAQQLQRTGRVDLAVAAYNAGPGAVRGSIPRNGETEFYVAKVLRRFRAGP
ncbi:MAG: lytic transglycosylase domain-containing protein [Myxococcota bacterium]